jgi:hypothetical protein
MGRGGKKFAARCCPDDVLEGYFRNFLIGWGGALWGGEAVVCPERPIQFRNEFMSNVGVSYNTQKGRVLAAANPLP